MLRAGETTEERDLVAIESALEVRLGKEFLAAFVCSPGLERELTIGYLLSSGIVEAADEIDGAVLTPFMNPAVKGLSLLWIIREIFVGQPEDALANELHFGGHNTLLQSGGGGNDLESRAWRI